MYQLDANNAFPYGDHNEDVYMKFAPGSILVCKLLKSPYVLRHASRNWFTKPTTATPSMGYTTSKNDYSLLYKKNGTSVVFLAIYVDDILVVGNIDVKITFIKIFWILP